MFELAFALGRTVAELEAALTWRELMAWNDFFQDRADEQKEAERRERRRQRRHGGDGIPDDLAGLSASEVAAAFGARGVTRRANAENHRQRS